MVSSIEIVPFFLPFGQSRLFCIYLAPTHGKLSAGILYLHPFAEEMHKSRRMAALQARQFAQRGHAVLMVDLLGCGDSTGDFGDADWETWKRCGEAAFQWLRQKTGCPMLLWGLRLGATLAVELSAHLSAIAGLILWQPVLTGDNFVNQFLRIKIASEMLGSEQSKLGIKEFRALLASGQAIEVGGYMLASRLAMEIEKLRLAEMPPPFPVEWFEISPNSGDALPPASSKTIEAWSNSGTRVRTHHVTAAPFWSSQEILEYPGLVTATADSLAGLLA